MLLVLLMLVSGKVLALDAWDGLLKQYVKGPTVDYAGLCKDAQWPAALAEYNGIDPKSLSADDRLAFWLNLYNLYDVKIVCDHYPLKNLNQLHGGGLIFAALMGRTVWDKQKVSVGGQNISLKDVDHAIIKKEFDQPLSQFGLFCGSRYCPPLRNEVYDGKRVKEQLADQAKDFFSDDFLNRFDVNTKTATISPIMDWNKGAFGASNMSDVLRIMADYFPAPASVSIKADPGSWKVQFSHYDLEVNDASQTTGK